MAKNKKPEARVEPRQETRKETVRRRRDLERNRRLVIGLAGVAVLLILLLAAGIIQELVIKPSLPIATVNGTHIPTNLYDKRVLFSWWQAQNQVTDPQGTSLQVLDQMVDETLIQEQAKQRGISVSPDEVSQTIETYFGYQRNPPTPAPTSTPAPSPTPGGEPTATPQGSPTPAEPTATPQPTPTPVTLEAYQTEYKDYLKRLKDATGLTEADFRALVETDLLRQKLSDAVTADVPTTEEQIHARHILVRIITPAPTPTAVPTGQPTPTPDPNATPTPQPRDDQQALARILEVKKRLDAGEDFATLAQQYSDDTGSAAQGGDLGWFGRGQMVAEFEDAAFKLQPGQVSDPVKTQFGYHLIKVEERDPARPLDPFTLQQKKAEAFNTWLTDLRTAAKVERNWSLDKIPATPAAPVGG
jgi:parvulin-like peptidyl-prolyl isomerase